MISVVLEFLFCQELILRTLNVKYINIVWCKKINVFVCTFQFF